MGFYQFKREQIIEASLDEVWDFISSPANLRKITPPQMGFEIISDDLSPKMYPGMIIIYNVRPLLGIKTKWVTEITQVKEKNFFIDEQRYGPYTVWHHQHHIEPITHNGNPAILMKDIISYQPPLGFIGTLIHGIIKKKLNQIFDYRHTIIEKKFKK